MDELLVNVVGLFSAGVNGAYVYAAVGLVCTVMVAVVSLTLLQVLLSNAVSVTV